MNYEIRSFKQVIVGILKLSATVLLIHLPTRRNTAEESGYRVGVHVRLQ